MKYRFLMLAVSLFTALAVGVGHAPTASALEARPGARFGQIDVLLTKDETKKAATQPKMAVWYCTVAMGKQPVVAVLTAGVTCAMTLQAGAAYALKRGKQAGVTYAWNGWWYWTY